MKKISVVLLVVILCGAVGLWFVNGNPFEQRHNLNVSCAGKLRLVDKDTPLLQFFADLSTARESSDCLEQQIVLVATSQQKEIYSALKEDMKHILDSMFYYKGDYYYSGRTDASLVAKYELFYQFQSFLYAKMSHNSTYEVANPYKLDDVGSLARVPLQLELEMLKLCNIEGRRNLEAYLLQAGKDMLLFFSTLAQDDKTQTQWMIEYENLLYKFVNDLRQDKYFMNPLNSKFFMEDWLVWEYMAGRPVTEESEVPSPPPLPFP